MKVLTMNGIISPVYTNPDGFPCIANNGGFSGEYLTADGRVCRPNSQGGTYRETRETDMIFDHTGRTLPAKEFAQ